MHGWKPSSYRKQRKQLDDLFPLLWSPKISLSPRPSQTNKQKPLTECPSLLFPVCLSLHPPYLLLLCMFFFFCSLLVNWLLAEPFDLELTVFHSVYNEQKVLGLKACARVLGLSHTTTRNRLFQSEKKSLLEVHRQIKYPATTRWLHSWNSNSHGHMCQTCLHPLLQGT